MRPSLLLALACACGPALPSGTDGVDTGSPAPSGDGGGDATDGGDGTPGTDGTDGAGGDDGCDGTDGGDGTGGPTDPLVSDLLWSPDGAYPAYDAMRVKGLQPDFWSDPVEVAGNNTGSVAMNLVWAHWRRGVRAALRGRAGGP